MYFEPCVGQKSTNFNHFIPVLRSKKQRCTITISPFVLFLLPGEEIENSNPDFFAGCCDQLQISQTTAYVKFKDLADELFKDQENGQRGKIRWEPKKLWRGIILSYHFTITYERELLYLWIFSFLGSISSFFLRVLPFLCEPMLWTDWTFIYTVFLPIPAHAPITAR